MSVGRIAAWLAIIAGGTAWHALRGRRARRFARAAESLGLEAAGTERYDGTRAGWRVSLQIAGPAREDRLSALSTRLSVRSDGRWPAAARVLGRWSRDAPSESRTLLRPDEAAEEEAAATAALLDPETRAAWSRFADHQLARSPAADAEVRGGELTLTIVGRVTDAGDLASRLDALAAMAGKLDRGGRSIARCLADECGRAPREERPPRLRLLARRFRGDADAEAACRAALATRDPECVLAVAPCLREEARPALESIVLDGASGVELRLRALAEWEWGPAGDDAGAALFTQLVASPVADLRRGALRSRQQPWGRIPFEAIARRVESMDDDEAASLASKLGRHEDPRVEPLLAGLLSRPSPEARVAALRSLGSCGTLSSVPAILPLARGLLVSADVQRAARLAIAEIRSRLGAAEAGRLSLIEAEGGLLSLPQSEGGALSASAPEGAVSPGIESEGDG